MEVMEVMQDEEEECVVPQIPIHRWYLVAYVGTSLSIISVLCNVLIARVLLQRKHSNFFFLGVLAVSDAFLSFSYGPVVAMDVVRYNVGIWLVRMWWLYIGPMLALCHVCMTFSCFMIILGTIERYLITVKSQYLNCFRHSRFRFTFIMLLIALLLRGTEVFEITIVDSETCMGVLEKEPALTDLGQTWIYGTIFKFYLRTITTVFIPFGLLCFLNYKIMNILRKQQRSAQMFRLGGSSEHKIKARSATRLLVLIVFSYLLANFLNLCITSWEFIDFDSIGKYETIYELMTDLVSIMYIFTCATRLFVYVFCNEEIRFALYDHFCGARKKKSLASEHDYKPIQKLHYDGSIRQKSIALGTDFDKIALAVVLSQRAKDLQQSFLVPSLGSAPSTKEHQNGNVRNSVNGKEEDINQNIDEDVNENSSFIIANPLANVSDPSTPTSEHKPSNNNNNSSLMVKLVPYPK